MPKTFQEAVSLTKGLGISYLWIDSLCIIQGSEEDWLHESKHMAAIYRGATLMIAAAGARDATEGLFMKQRTFSKPTRLPYIHNGYPDGQFYMMHIDVPLALRRNPLHGCPLRERGWAFQEWYLAQRAAGLSTESNTFRLKLFN
ncbi:heterokaryon incompatibility [Clohesyomyces aquaticus]|uniref:Heterokaryon incompatibility n=1 Tax=Clohesyomyces aquaticus TaxID=1231657 RepID=A0A1Y1YS95_9PLEO|nr:heterokaryon incompatibility [Clohesyomyces aquaticus]